MAVLPERHSEAEWRDESETQLQLGAPKVPEKEETYIKQLTMPEARM